MAIIQGTSKSSAAGYTIDQSIRFNDDDDAHLYNTSFSASPTSSTDCTFSTWVKRGNFGSYQVMLYGGNPAGSTAESIRFDNDEDLRISQASSAYDLKTDQKFRDVAGWYHITVAFSTGAATASDRIKLWVNGQRVTSFSTETYPSSGYSTNFTSGAASVAHVLGANAYEGLGPDSQHFDGYQAEINFVDGQVLDPTSFGETNADTGQWVPIAYTGSYGTNGFYITGADSADLGADDSGNGNDFTSSSGGFSAADQVTDSPTDNYGVINPLDNGRPSNITLSDGNLTAAFAGSGYSGGIRSSIFFDSEDSDGWYAECTLDSLAIASVFRAGVANASLNLSTADAQTSADGWAYSDQGAKLNNSYTTGYGSSVGVGDVVGIAVRNGKIYFAVNNTWQGSADPVTESNPAFSNLTGDVAFCQSTNTGGSYAHTATWNFGQTGFTYTPPTGYKSLRVQDLPDPIIADPSAYFQSLAYASTGTSTAFVQDGNSQFEPGLVWVKSRTGANNHLWFDQVRGATKFIRSDTANAENTVADTLTAFNSNGFTAGADSVNWGINYPGRNNVAWMWAADGTSGSSNTDGATSSTVSASTTSGFAIVKWTGTGSATTLGHGLGSVPKMIWVKNLADVDSWVVYHEDVGATKGLTLDTTATPVTASTFFNNTAPTSSVFSVGSGGRTNGSSDGMIAYCFAEIPAFSRISSFVGNGSSDGPMIYTGFRPAQVVIKEITTADSWEMYDSARDPINVTGRTVRADSANAEFDGRSLYRSVDFLSNGFKIRTSNATINSSGATFIFWAFAERSFRYANAR